ncbi:hypothetical protein N665_0353s0004 [Sinapis alba]|nr:hypothetical protein N665_0353s0004 [Sinapis alba]
MEEEKHPVPPIRIHDRIFVATKELVGVRVTPDHKPYAIRKIINALNAKEVNTIRASPFGKLVEIGEEPSFSRRFGRFIISRQLKFAYVTGLNCRKLPKHTKRAKKNISGKPYWGELFGTLKEVPITSVVRMVKRRTVTDRGMCVKYALLALLAAVILPTTHTPCISQDHAELIKDIDAFFTYPWGRISFEMLMSTIPALTEVINDGSSSGSEGDCCKDDDLLDEDKNGKRSISSGHARDTDAAENVEVHSVIVEYKEHFKASSNLGWSNEDEDPIVDNLMSLVEQRFPFNKSSFIGAKLKQTNHKTTSEVIDCESVASMVTDKVSEGLSWIERKISILSESFLMFQINTQDSSIAQPGNVTNVARDVHQPDIRRPSLSHVGIQTDSVQNDSISDAIRFANQAISFTIDIRQGIQSDVPSEGQTPHDIPEKMDMHNCYDDILFRLTQEERPHQKETVTEGDSMCEDQLVACRKSKRHKALPRSLVGKYECDMRLLNRSRVALVDPNNTGGNIDYSSKFSSLLDKLYTIGIGQSKTESNDLYKLIQRSTPLQPKSNYPVFMDTQFVSQLSKLFSKFSKMSKKGSFRFPSNILERFLSNPEAEHFYFPFNLDKKHWVGVCVDCPSWSIVVMDCNIALSHLVTPITQMFPFLLKQAGKQLVHKDARALPIERPQQHSAKYMCQYCKCITPEVLGTEVERLAVMFYETTVGML